MLVLTRKPQEVIQIGPNVKITIVRVSGQSVRIGIDAPKDVLVIRGELAFDDPTADGTEVVQQTAVKSSRSSRTAAILRRMKSITDPPGIEASSKSQQGIVDEKGVLPCGPRFTEKDVISGSRWSP